MDDAVREARRIFAQNEVKDAISYMSTISRNVEESRDTLKMLIGNSFDDIVKSCDRVVDISKVSTELIALKECIETSSPTHTPPDDPADVSLQDTIAEKIILSLGAQTDLSSEGGVSADVSCSPASVEVLRMKEELLNAHGHIELGGLCDAAQIVSQCRHQLASLTSCAPGQSDNGTNESDGTSLSDRLTSNTEVGHDEIASVRTMLTSCEQRIVFSMREQIRCALGPVVEAAVIYHYRHRHRHTSLSEYHADDNHACGGDANCIRPGQERAQRAAAESMRSFLARMEGDAQRAMHRLFRQCMHTLRHLRVSTQSVRDACLCALPGCNDSTEHESSTGPFVSRLARSARQILVDLDVRLTEDGDGVCMYQLIIVSMSLVVDNIAAMCAEANMRCDGVDRAGAAGDEDSCIAVGGVHVPGASAADLSVMHDICKMIYLFQYLAEYVQSALSDDSPISPQEGHIQVSPPDRTLALHPWLVPETAGREYDLFKTEDLQSLVSQAQQLSRSSEDGFTSPGSRSGSARLSDDQGCLALLSLPPEQGAMCCRSDFLRHIRAASNVSRFAVPPRDGTSRVWPALGHSSCHAAQSVMSAEEAGQMVALLRALQRSVQAPCLYIFLAYLCRDPIALASCCQRYCQTPPSHTGSLDDLDMTDSNTSIIDAGFVMREGASEKNEHIAQFGMRTRSHAMEKALSFGMQDMMQAALRRATNLQSILTQYVTLLARSCAMEYVSFVAGEMSCMPKDDNRTADATNGMLVLSIQADGDCAQRVLRLSMRFSKLLSYYNARASDDDGAAAQSGQNDSARDVHDVAAVSSHPPVSQLLLDDYELVQAAHATQARLSSSPVSSVYGDVHVNLHEGASSGWNDAQHSIQHTANKNSDGSHAASNCRRGDWWRGVDLFARHTCSSKENTAIQTQSSSPGVDTEQQDDQSMERALDEMDTLCVQLAKALRQPRASPTEPPANPIHGVSSSGRMTWQNRGVRAWSGMLQCLTHTVHNIADRLNMHSSDVTHRVHVEWQHWLEAAVQALEERVREALATHQSALHAHCEVAAEGSQSVVARKESSRSAASWGAAIEYSQNNNNNNSTGTENNDAKMAAVTSTALQLFQLAQLADILAAVVSLAPRASIDCAENNDASMTDEVVVDKTATHDSSINRDHTYLTNKLAKSSISTADDNSSRTKNGDTDASDEANEKSMIALTSRAHKLCQMCHRPWQKMLLHEYRVAFGLVYECTAHEMRRLLRSQHAHAVLPGSTHRGATLSDLRALYILKHSRSFSLCQPAVVSDKGAQNNNSQRAEFASMQTSPGQQPHQREQQQSSEVRASEDLFCPSSGYPHQVSPMLLELLYSIQIILRHVARHSPSSALNWTRCVDDTDTTSNSIAKNNTRDEKHNVTRSKYASSDAEDVWKDEGGGHGTRCIGDDKNNYVCPVRSVEEAVRAVYTRLLDTACDVFNGSVISTLVAVRVEGAKINRGDATTSATGDNDSDKNLASLRNVCACWLQVYMDAYFVSLVWTSMIDSAEKSPSEDVEKQRGMCMHDILRERVMPLIVAAARAEAAADSAVPPSRTTTVQVAQRVHTVLSHSAHALLSRMALVLGLPRPLSTIADKQASSRCIDVPPSDADLVPSPSSKNIDNNFTTTTTTSSANVNVCSARCGDLGNAGSTTTMLDAPAPIWACRRREVPRFILLPLPAPPTLTRSMMSDAYTSVGHAVPSTAINQARVDRVT